MKRKLLSMLLILCVVASLMPAVTIFASAENISSNINESTTWNDGDIVTGAITIDGSSKAVTITVNGTVEAKGNITVKGNVKFVKGTGETAKIEFSQNQASLILGGTTGDNLTLENVSVSTTDGTGIILMGNNQVADTVTIKGGTMTANDYLVDYATSLDTVILDGCTLAVRKGLLYTVTTGYQTNSQGNYMATSPTVTIESTVTLEGLCQISAANYKNDLTISADSNLTDAMFNVTTQGPNVYIGSNNEAEKDTAVIIKNSVANGSIFTGNGGSLYIYDNATIEGAGMTTKLVSSTVSALYSLTLDGCTLKNLSVQGNTDSTVMMEGVDIKNTVTAKGVLFNRVDLVRTSNQRRYSLVKIEKLGTEDDTAPSSALLNIKAGYTHSTYDDSEIADTGRVQIEIADGALVSLGGTLTKISNLAIGDGNNIYAGHSIANVTDSSHLNIPYYNDIHLGGSSQHAEVGISTTNTNDDDTVNITSSSEGNSGWYTGAAWNYIDVFTSVSSDYYVSYGASSSGKWAALKKAVATATSWTELATLFSGAPTNGVTYTITLGNSISSTANDGTEKSLTVPAGANIVLDLAGYTLSGENLQPVGGPTIYVTAGGALTVKDSSDEKTGAIIGNPDSSTSVQNDTDLTSNKVTAIYVNQSSAKTSLTIEGGNIADGTNGSGNPAANSNNSSTVYIAGTSNVQTTTFTMSGGKITGLLHFNDNVGTVKITDGEITEGIQADRKTTVNISGGTIAGTLSIAGSPSGTYNLIGGTYTDYTESTLPAAYIAGGYEAKDNDDEDAVVSKKSTGDYTTVSDEESLKIALDGESPIKISLSNDITLTGSVTIPADKAVTIDLNGYSLDANGAFCPVVKVYGTFNLEDSSGDDSGEITGAGTGGVFVGGGVQVYSGGTFNMYGGTITDNKGGHGGGVLVYGEGAVMNMSGGKITGNTPTYHTGVYSLYGGTINVSGGTITGNVGGQSGVDFNVVGASASLTGGTYGNDVSAYVAEGYKCISNGDGTYSVVEANGDTGSANTGTAAYTLTLELNDGSTTATVASTFAAGEKVYLPGADTMSKENATFAGWYSDAAFTSGPYNYFSGYAENRTYYAKWLTGDVDTGEVGGDSSKSYTLTLDAAGGTISDSLTASTGSITDNSDGTWTFSGGANILLPANVTRAGYAFAGWYRTDNGKGRFGSFSGWYTDKSYYAKWISVDDGGETDPGTAESYTLTLDTNGGSTTAATTDTFTGGATVTLPAAETMTRTDSIFAGWYKDADLTDGPYEQFTGYYSSVTYYAKWEAQETATGDDAGDDATTGAKKTYTLTLVTGGHGSVSGTYNTVETNAEYTTYFLGGSSVSVPTPTASSSDYIFKGWYNETGAGPYSGFTGFYKNRTYTAKWTAVSKGSASAGDEFTVKLDTGKGTLTESFDDTKTYSADEIVTLPEAERAGYTFKGWLVDGTGDPVMALTGYSGEVELTAQYVEGDVNVNGYGNKSVKTITITLDLNGGSYTTVPDGYTTGTATDIYKTTVTGGGDYALPAANPTRSGYTFAGWYNENGDGPFTSGSGWYADKTYTAKWTAVSSGGSGSGSAVNVGKSENGSVSISPANPSKGDTVTVTVKPDSGYKLKDLTVTDENGNELTLTKKSDTQYTFTMPDGKVNVKAEFEAKGDCPAEKFTDVDLTQYYHEALDWAIENGVTEGTGDTTFSPDASCTRAQAVTLIWRAAGAPEPEGREMPFADVAADAYYYKAVLWASEQGITVGTSATTFSPDVSCTRAQIVTMLWRAAGSPKGSQSSFTDVPANAYYYGAVAWAVENGITIGTGNNQFSPNNGCTRAHIVTFLYRSAK